MLIRQISLKRGVTVRTANIANHHEIQEAVSGLETPHPRKVIALVGEPSHVRYARDRAHGR